MLDLKSNPGLAFKSAFLKLGPDCGPVIRRSISNNPRLNCDSGSLLFCSKAFARIMRFLCALEYFIEKAQYK